MLRTPKSRMSVPALKLWTVDISKLVPPDAAPIEPNSVAVPPGRKAKVAELSKVGADGDVRRAKGGDHASRMVSSGRRLVEADLVRRGVAGRKVDRVGAGLGDDRVGRRRRVAGDHVIADRTNQHVAAGRRTGGCVADAPGTVVEVVKLRSAPSMIHPPDVEASITAALVEAPRVLPGLSPGGMKVPESPKVLPARVVTPELVIGQRHVVHIEQAAGIEVGDGPGPGRV